MRDILFACQESIPGNYFLVIFIVANKNACITRQHALAVVYVINVLGRILYDIYIYI